MVTFFQFLNSNPENEEVSGVTWVNSKLDWPLACTREECRGAYDLGVGFRIRVQG